MSALLIKLYCTFNGYKCFLITQNHGNDARLSRVMPPDRNHHFFVIVVVRGYKIRTDQEKNDLRRPKVLFDLLVTLHTGTDVSIVPVDHTVRTSQERKMFIQFIT